MNTTALKRFAQQARVILKDGVQSRLMYWGFDAKGNVTDEPMQVEGGAIFRGEAIDDPSLVKKWDALHKAVQVHGIQHIVEEAAYTWFNRLMAVRILAKNGYIRPQLEFEGERVRVPLIVSNARRGQFPALTSEEKKQLNELLKDDSAEIGQFALLITAFCRTNKLLGRVFGRLDDYTELLLPVNILAGNGFIHLLNDSDFITDDDYRQVELIGWLYQFYISEKKDEVFKSFKNKKKAEAEDIPAATQIFTPNWIVKYMVQNTVGRLWLDLNPDSALKEKMTYLVENTDEARSESLIREVSEIKLLDPACGSGHILVEGFDLLFDMYIDEGYSKREAVSEILRRNLYGLDIDLRAAQLASFALLLKAAAKDPSILDDDIVPQVYAMPEKYNFSTIALQKFLGEEPQYLEPLQNTLTLMQQAQNLGSIMQVEISPDTREYLQKQLDYWQKRQETDMFHQEEFNHLSTYIRIILLLTQQYEAVAANPPYMGGGNMNEELKAYVTKHYPKSKSDLFSVFMETGMQLSVANGRMGMINMHSWMFLSSFEALRKEIIESYFIENMIHLGPRTFDELSGEVVQNTAFVLKNTKDIGHGVYYRLVDGKNCSEKEQMFLQKENIYSHISQSNFEKIPGSPIAYWVSEVVVSIMSECASLSTFADPRQGLATGDNNRFLRNIWEVSKSKIGQSKWVLCSKGGTFRRWYGNIDLVVNWENDGFEIKNFKDEKGKLRSRPQNSDYYFDKKGFTWSTIGSYKISYRFFSKEWLFETKGSVCFPQKDDDFLVMFAYLNTTLVDYFLRIFSPTLDFHEGPVGRLPYIKLSNETVESLVENNIVISKEDWNTRETSWDFQENELIKLQRGTIQEAYSIYLNYWTEQFIQLHNNEVELNKIFIGIYGLQEELAPEVKLKDITILQEELDYNALGELATMEQLPNPSQLPIKIDEVIKQFISYAIGCMMGRYRLDQPNLHIAHPNPTEDEIASYEYNGKTFQIDEDAIIPLMDATCSFSDNALLRIKDFIRQVWSNETEIENINFIESALGKDLEAYLVKDFWKDHCRRYQKRPIYWLFASPKGAFQVLTYMHRMNKYTVEKIRSNYLLKHIQNLESRCKIMESESSTLDRNGQRTLDKIRKDIEECRNYDLYLKNIADQQIEFDLDDGVVVNYAKFGDVVAKIK